MSRSSCQGSKHIQSAFRERRVVTDMEDQGMTCAISGCLVGDVEREKGWGGYGLGDNVDWGVF